jgi:NADPH2:quinone reductase
MRAMIINRCGSADELTLKDIERLPHHLIGLADLWAAGKIRIPQLQILPLEEASQAHQMLEAGHTRGKIVLAI